MVFTLRPSAHPRSLLKPRSLGTILEDSTSFGSAGDGCRKNLPLYGPNILKKHQFTTRRLLANVTVLAVVLALVIAFPGPARAVTILLLLYSPAILISAFAIWRSRKRLRTIPLMLSFVFAAWLLSPRLFVSWAGTPTFWDLFMVDFTTVGLFTGVGALIAACIDAFL